jgi:hypothetical protein
MRFTGIVKGPGKSASEMQPLAGGYHSSAFDERGQRPRAPIYLSFSCHLLREVLALADDKRVFEAEALVEMA